MNYNSWYFVIFEIVVQLTKYIVQLLHQHDCVIIPDFGGFVAQYKPATLDSVTGFYSPPSKQILFNINGMQEIEKVSEDIKKVIGAIWILTCMIAWL